MESADLLGANPLEYMNIKNILLPALVGGSLSSLALGETLSNQSQTVQAVIEAPKVDLSKFATKAGFAAYLPKNTEGYLSILNAYQSYQDLQQTELGKVLIQVMQDEGVYLNQWEESDQGAMIKAVLGEELFFAFGESAGEQGKLVIDLLDLSSVGQMKSLVEMVAAELKGKLEPSEFRQRATGLSDNPEAALEILKGAYMPPITIGFKVSDQNMRNSLAAQLAGGLGFLTMGGDDHPITALNEEIGGVAMTGFSVSGEKAVAQVGPSEQKQLAQELGGQEKAAQALEILKKRDLHVATGIKGDYIVLHLGADLKKFRLVEKPEDSLLSQKAAGFLADYAEKDLRYLLLSPAKGFSDLGEDPQGFASWAIGLQEGLADTDAFGDTRDVQTLLGHVAKLDKKLFGMYEYVDGGGVGYVEDGFKMETHGISNTPAIDSSEPHAFANLGEDESVVLFSNSRANEEFTKTLLELLNALGETAYVAARQAASLEIDSSDFQGFQMGFGMFDQMASKDLLQIWSALTGEFAAGTGSESALVIDLKGTLPTVPLPEPIAKEGRIPRITYVTPIRDRAQLSAAWTKIEGSLANILKTVEMGGGPPIPMQELIETESNGIKSFFYPIPMTTKNARPIAATSAKNFYLSTSPTSVNEIEAAAKKAAGPLRYGSFTRVNFQAAQKLGADWLEIAKKNKEVFFTTEVQLEQFEENLPLIEKVVKATEELEDLVLHTRTEDGETRGSLHFNMKK